MRLKDLHLDFEFVFLIRIFYIDVSRSRQHSVVYVIRFYIFINHNLNLVVLKNLTMSFFRGLSFH